jgi:tetratricopeptide (TPR) repeat protein
MWPTLKAEEWTWLKDACTRAATEGRDPVLAECRERHPHLEAALQEMIADYESAGETPLVSWFEQAAFSQPVASMRTFSEGEVVSQRYQVRSFLGRGGMGEVYEVSDRHLAERGSIALKTVRNDLARNREAAGRFEREVRNALVVAHPNVCRIFDVGRHLGAQGPVLYLTMEYLPGLTLASWLKERDARRNPVPEAEALPLIRQMAAGLAAIHARRIIHRDFKPGNVMLVRDDAADQLPNSQGALRAVITDFGLSRGAAEDGEGDVTGQGVAVGTPAFMAPEQISGNNALTPAVDIFALGVTAHEMLTGRRPEPGAPLTELDAAPVSAWLRAAVAKCLERDPRRRFAHGGEVLAALEAGPGRPWIHIPASSRRWVAGGAAALVIVLGAVAWLETRTTTLNVPPDVRALTARAATKIVNGSFHDAGTLLEQAIAKTPHYAMAHAMLADAYNGQELTSKANREVLRAIDANDLRRSSADERRYIEAVRLTMARDYPAAAAAFQSYYEKADAAERADRAVLLGRALEMARKPAEAAAVYRSAGKRPAALLAPATMDSREQDVARVANEFAAANAEFEKQGEKAGVVQGEYAYGAALSRWGRIEDSRRVLDSCVENARALDDAWDALRCQQLLSALVRGTREESAQAPVVERDLKAQIEEANTRGFGIILGRALYTLGNFRVNAGDYDAADMYFRQALARAEEEESLRLKAQAQFALADLHVRINRPDEAEPEARGALQFYDNDRSVRDIAECVIGLVWALKDQGKLEEATSLLRDRQALLPSLAPRERMRMLAAGAALEAAKEDYPGALADFRALLDIDRTYDATAYQLWIPELEGDLGQMTEAHQALDGILRRKDLTKPQAANARTVQAELALYSGDARAAKRILATPPLTDDDSFFVAISELRLGESAQAIVLCRAALARPGVSPADSRARLCLLEADSILRDGAGAAQIFGTIGKTWKPQVESLWKAEAMLLSLNPADEGLRANALKHLDDLHKKWGDAAFRSYIGRADVRHLLQAGELKI